MRHALIALLIAATPVAAEDDSGTDLMEEALRLFMRGLMQEVEPALDDLTKFLDNFDAYHPPEVLPNGDIIIRRKQPDEEEAETDIEL